MNDTRGFFHRPLAALLLLLGVSLGGAAWAQGGLQVRYDAGQVDMEIHGARLSDALAALAGEVGFQVGGEPLAEPQPAVDVEFSGSVE
ncbi:MAG: hypothetical protein M3Z21_04380, partial [Pseudomonadota bacterium]|nr:hypothetical protein [Pseudomonadota bacterium]